MDTIQILCITALILIAWIYIGKLFLFHWYPRIQDKNTKLIEKNPKWLVGDSKTQIYGLQDIDFLLVENTSRLPNALPRMRSPKDNTHFEFLLEECDTSPRDADEIIRLALMGKIAIKYGMLFPDKPIHWLAILCYMLDGGDIRQEAVSWKEKGQKTS